MFDNLLRLPHLDTRRGASLKTARLDQTVIFLSQKITFNHLKRVQCNTNHNEQGGAAEEQGKLLVDPKSGSNGRQDTDQASGRPPPEG